MSKWWGMRHCAALVALTSLLSAGCQVDRVRGAEPGFQVEGELVSITRKSPVRFDVAEAREGPTLPLPSVTARITAVEALTSPSFAPLSGRVVEAKVRLGDHVKKGQQIVLVRTADLPTLERDLRSAELAVSTRTASVGRMRALVEARAGSQNDLLLAESELAEARLTLQAAKARLKSLQIARDKDDTTYWVIASRSGTVVQLDATAGLQVGPDRAAPIATVADLAEVLAVADVPPRDALELEKGVPARVLLPGLDEAVSGVVEVVSEVVDPDRQTVPVRVRIDNAARRLRPNAYVDLEFGSVRPRTTVLLPAAAVVRDGATAVVFVEGEPGTFSRRKVVVGRRSRDQVEISSGVAAGERVVTTGALLLVNALDVEA